MHKAYARWNPRNKRSVTGEFVTLVPSFGARNATYYCRGSLLLTKGGSTTTLKTSAPLYYIVDIFYGIYLSDMYIKFNAFQGIFLNYININLTFL